MKHYFLSGLSAKQKTALSDSLIVLSDMELNGKVGLLLDETNKNFALQVLNAREVKLQATGYDGIFEVVYKIRRASDDDEAGGDKSSGDKTGSDKSGGDKSAAKSKAKADAASAPTSKLRTDLDADHQRYRDLYIAACSARVSELVLENRKALVNQRLEIENLQRELIRELRAVRLAEARLAGGGITDREVFAQEFDAIFEVPKVKGVRVEDGVISVHTDVLFTTDPHTGRRHELGEFLIQFLTDGQSDCIRWFNITRRVNASRDEQQAPNVFKSGRSSLHAIKDSLIDLVAELQFAVATQLAIDFIEQVDGEEPESTMIDRWPDEEKLREKLALAASESDAGAGDDATEAGSATGSASGSATGSALL